jgi:plastocyanin
MINSVMRNTLVAAAGCVLLAVMGGVLGHKVVAAGSAQITIQNFDFEPKALTVAPGTEVTWLNGDEEPHNIVNADPGQPRLFRSPGLDGGEKYSFTFDKPGTYRYICSIHPHMEGTIIVKAPG